MKKEATNDLIMLDNINRTNCPGCNEMAEAVNSKETGKELYLYCMKQLDPKNYKKYYRRLRMGADFGNACCQYNLALLVLHGDFYKKNYLQAKLLLELSSQNGNPDADYTLGQMYCDGSGVKRNVDKGYELIMSALEKGSELAI